MPSLTVIKPGMLTTIQDLGRWGHQGSGVPVAGPMDEYSHRLANRLVGNAPHAAALEITILGPELQSDSDVECGVAGATFPLTAGDVTVPMPTRFTLTAGVRLKLGTRTAGTRATLAVRGGIDGEAPFGSRATSLISRRGPLGGRGRAAGDVLAVAPTDRPDTTIAALPLPLPRGGAQVRV